jgi:hypothetical protein
MKLAYSHGQLPPPPSAAVAAPLVYHLPNDQLRITNLVAESSGIPRTPPADTTAAAVVSFPLLGYRGSSLVSLNEVHAYLEKCGTIEDAVENCGKLLNASR